MERMSSNYYMRNRAETINKIRTARRLVLARLTVESTMGHGESQIGYLANYITLHGGDAHRHALTHRCRVIACMSWVAGAGVIDPRERRPSKFNGHTHRTPNADRVIYYNPKINEEFSGL